MKSIIKFLLVIVALINCQNIIACECVYTKWSIELVNKNIQRSDLIFLGEVIDSNEEKYSFKVLDLFKGNINSDTIFGKPENGCSMIPTSRGLWIIYAQIDKDGIIDFSSCDVLSRSLTTFSSLPPPPKPAVKENQYSEIREQELSIAMRNWLNEYIILRNLKEKNIIARSENNGEKNSSFVSYISLGLAVLALFIAIIKK